MLKYGVQSLKAVSKFFSYRNDVDIFTEDKIADKEFYKTIFNRLLDDDIKINDVTPLGSKTNVLNAFDNRDRNSRRKEYYIIDGDLELIIDNNRNEEDGLIILDSYCIENYLIEESGVIEFAYFSFGDKAREEIKGILNFDDWLESHSDVLMNLFLNFGILRKHGGGPVLLNAHSFLTQDKKETVLDSDKVNAYADKIRDEIVQKLKSSGMTEEAAVDIYEVDFNLLKNKWEFESSNLLRVVSGKDYLLPLLQFKINHCVSKSGKLFPIKSLKLFLASHFNLSKLEFVKTKIQK